VAAGVPELGVLVVEKLSLNDEVVNFLAREYLVAVERSERLGSNVELRKLRLTHGLNIAKPMRRLTAVAMVLQ
jgi:hypothetical protein